MKIISMIMKRRKSLREHMKVLMMKIFPNLDKMSIPDRWTNVKTVLMK